MSTPDIETLRARCADALALAPNLTHYTAATKKLHADMLAALEQQARELEALRADLAGAQRLMTDLLADVDSESRRVIGFSNMAAEYFRVMRAAVVEAEISGADKGMVWIRNTLAGPGHLPDIKAARAEDGAQAMFDRETREHEAFRAAHPGPAAPAKGAAS